MFSKPRSAAASPASKKPAKTDKAAAAAARAEKRAAKAAKKAAAKMTGAVGKADRLVAARAAAAKVNDEVRAKDGLSRAEHRAQRRTAKQADKPAYAQGEEPGFFDLAEWSLRRKVALVLAVPVILAAAFGGLRVNTERHMASNYAASASQVKVLRPAVAYLAAAERAAVLARQLGVNDPKLDAAVRDVVEAHIDLVNARDAAALTSEQRAQVNDVITLSEQLRTGYAYVSISSSVTQIRQLERGITDLISMILEDQTKQEPNLLYLAQALDGRLSVALQEIQAAEAKRKEGVPVELYTEFGVEQSAIDRLAISLGLTNRQVQAIRAANSVRVTNAGKGDFKISGEGYEAYDVLIGDVLTTIDDNLASDARTAKVLAWADTIIIGTALLAAIILALLVSRLLLTPIRRVRSGALEVAHVRLPEAVARIRAGEEPGEIVPIGVTTHEETGQLARAVDDLHRQAVKLASGEAELRAQVGDMFVTLSRRNTSLINQQLGLIETLESDEEDPQRLESLFRLDHLASRMRRNAESLVILSGAPTRATEQDDLSLTDVLQAAIAGVQDYRRVQLDAAPAQRVSGEAAADVVHLLAELVDNALSYSPPSSRVLVTSSFTRGGVIVQVIDGGLGMAEDALSEINERLRSGGEVTPDTARRMGLFVVSRLAERHGLSVQLEQNDRMGVTATVFLPTSVLSDTARLEAGSGSFVVESSTGTGAQVIELGTSTATFEDDEQEDYVDDADADVVAYLRPEPEAQPVQELDPITAAINAYGLPQRRPGASGAGQADAPASVGGGFFERVEPEAGAAETEATPADEDDVVDAVLAEDEVDVEVEVEVDQAELAELADGAIALGPVGEDTPVVVEVATADDEAAEEVDDDADDHADEAADEATDEATDEAADTAADTAADEAADTAAGDEEADETDQVEEPSEVAEVESVEEPGEDTEHVAQADDPEDQDDADADDAEQDHAEQEDAEQEDAEQEDADQLAPVATLPLRSTSALDAGGEAASQLNGSRSAATSSLAQRLHGLAAAARGASDASIAHDFDSSGNALLSGNGASLGGARSSRPASMDEDETPIFRSLRSNWLSADTGERPWADSEVDAGWDAADRVEATPPTRRTETGLPMRRPGNRLIPGGLSSPAPVQTVRDPEAIRARLAAHAAGVSRGRNAASVPNPSSQEADPA